MLLGDPPSGLSKISKGTPETDTFAPADGEANLPRAATQWTKKNAVTAAHLEQYFHVEDGAATAIALPGVTTKRSEQVINTYLVQGIVGLLTNGEPAFTDEDARKLCEHFGCYDTTNHAKYTKEFGNRITGSKAGGWRLTAPGLTAAAELIKQSASTQ
jgi:hypothetical protein